MLNVNQPRIEPNGLGDVDGNGKIDSEDERLIQGYLEGQVNLTSEQKSRADINQDGQITAKDAQDLHMFLEENGGQEGDSLSKIEITKAPDKTQYIEGQDFDPTGMVVQATYTSGNTQNVDNYTIQNGTNLTTNQSSVTISYDGKTASQAITVTAKSVTKIEISKLPTKVEYLQNSEQLNLAGGEITVTYNDGSHNTVSMTSTGVSASGFDNTTLGKNTITISYQSKTATFDVTIVENNVTSIAITNQPDKTQYFEGDDFDPTGMVVQATYTSGNTQNIDNYTIQNGTNLTKDQTEVIISYNGKTANQAITVSEKEILKIEVSKSPSKIEYLQNTEQLDLSGGEITVTYSDETESTILMTDDNITASGFDNTTLGENTITISYQSKTATFNVTIIENTVVSIAITNQPDKTEYFEGQDFDKSGMIVEATLLDDSKQTISNYEIQNGTNLKIDQTEVTISYSGKTATQAITVTAKSVTKIEISKLPTKVEYLQNTEQLDLADGEITVTYNDGSKNTISMTNSSIKATGFDNTTLGKNTITLEYQTKTTTFDVNIVKKSADNNSNSNSDTTNYKSSESNNKMKLDDSSAKSDKTMVSGTLPYTGIASTCIILISIFSLIGIISYIRYKRSY